MAIWVALLVTRGKDRRVISEHPWPPRVGTYTVVRPLGEGAHGIVYEARAEDGASVALKTLRREVVERHGADLVARFLREAKICSELRDPHIVAVREYGLDPGSGLVFQTMDLLRGRDLEALVTEDGPLEPVDALEIALQVASALEKAEEHGIVHRDLKPGNIFVDTAGARFRAVLCDFGLARVLDEDGALTRSGQTFGTPLYMSPEQLVASRRVDVRTDIWALGMTLYFALCGRTAFDDAKTFAELCIRISSEDAPPLQSFAPWVDAEMAEVVQAMLLRDLDARVPRAKVLVAALRRLASTRSTTQAMGSGQASPRRLSHATRSVRERPARQLRHFSELESPSAPAPRPSLEVLGPKRIGPYDILRVLGQGGMGVVYEGVGPAGERTAVKVLTSTSSSSHAILEGRFLREIETARSVTHPHLVAVRDQGFDAELGKPYFAMELLAGCDLAQEVLTRGPLEPAIAARLFVQACDGLGALHAAQLVHRDIKPANLFLANLATSQGPSTTTSGDEVVSLKICDFGIAKFVGPSEDPSKEALTQTGAVMGSPLYMSPEQATNAKNVDASSDLWSLCVSLYESLSGEPPWAGRESLGELVLAICTQRLPPLHSIAPWVPTALAEAVDRGVAPERSERYASAAELRAALLPFAGDAVVLARTLRTPRARRAVQPAWPISRAAAALASPPVLARTDPVVLPTTPLPRIAFSAVVSLVIVGGVLAYTGFRSSAPPAPAATGGVLASLPVVPSSPVAPEARASDPSPVLLAPTASDAGDPSHVASVRTVAAPIPGTPDSRIKPAKSVGTVVVTPSPLAPPAPTPSTTLRWKYAPDLPPAPP
jgi:eukaryotic-like serine/threonine-protein kinase